MYFEKLPKLNYKLPQQPDIEMQDIFRRVTFTESTRKDESNFETYIVKDHERPEDIAESFYGDASWWWLVMMCNDTINVESEWVKSTDEVTSLFSNYLNGYSYHVFEDLDILPNDLMVKRDITPGNTGHSFSDYGVISSYDRLYHKIDVKQYAGDIDAGDEVYVYRAVGTTAGLSGGGFNLERYDLISGLGDTGCFQRYSGDASCVVFNGPTDGALLCATAGATFAKIQRRDAIKNSIVDFEFNGSSINPYSEYVTGVGPSGDFLKYQNMCGMTATILYEYITGTLSGVDEVTVENRLHTTNDRNRTIKLLSPNLKGLVSAEISTLLKGGVPRGTTKIIE